MSLWIKADEKEVYLNIKGNVYVEHIEFLKNYLMERLQYGYKRIVIDVNDVSLFAEEGIHNLKYLREQILGGGGELIIKDKEDLIQVEF